MVIGKVVLLAKTIGVKRNLCSFTEDVFRFINKKGEPRVFKIFKDEFQRPVKKVLQNETTGAVKERVYYYKTYTFDNGKTVPYKFIRTSNTDGSTSREIIARVQNGNKFDVTKTKLTSSPLENGNILEKCFVARFSNGKKATGVFTDIERTPNDEILSKKTFVQKENGKRNKVVSDLFYCTAAYDDIDFKSKIIKMLKSEMGLKDYGINVKGAHRGYTPGGCNNFARYIHSTKTVSLNVDVPKVNTRKGFVSEASHELLHAWQKREVELLEQGLLKGARKEAAQVYKNEFSNYIRGSATDKTKHLAYEVQVVETKAREFQKFVEEYYNRNMRNIYNKYVQGIIPPQIGITVPLPDGVLKKIP